jgi:DMSO/TMAO reductase YedYZ molybdopterin-dependent catalytic subunit
MTRRMASTKLPPGQVAVEKALLRHKGEIPKIDNTTWKLTVAGNVKKPLSLGWEDLRALPAIETVSDFHCVEGWSVLNNRWKGVLFKTIVEMATPENDAEYVVFESADRYSTSLPLSDLEGEDVLLAYELNGQLLAPERGGPLRLVVPQKYAYKSAMWLERILFTDTPELGYWEKKGYSDTADPWKEDRYA